MDRALAKLADDAAVGQRDIAHRRIVRKHGDDRRLAACVCNAGGLTSPEFEERAALFRVAVEHGDIVSGLDEICRHRRPHSAQPDKSNLHVDISPALMHMPSASVKEFRQ